MPKAEPPKKPRFLEHPLDYSLGLFAEVHTGEAPTALLLALNVFLLLTAYYLLKVAREPLILTGGGAEVKSYAAAGQAVLLVFVASAYGWLARHVGRMQLIAIITLFFVANLVVFWALGMRGAPLGIPFYLWVGIFNLTVIAQFWSFAADIYTIEQGKRLFPILGIGSSVGAAAGAWIAKRALVFGPFALMLGAAGLLLVCLANTWIVNRREGGVGQPGEKHVDEPFSKDGGFELLLRDRYLMAVGGLAFVLNWVNTMGEYILDRTLLVAASEQAHGGVADAMHFVGAFKADYFQWVNITGVVLQLFAVSRIIKYLGVRAALFIMPVVSFAGFSVLAFLPILSLILVTKVAENGLDYSLQNTARQALWLMTSRDAKYKAKQVIDTFLVRAGDVMTALVVWTGVHLAFGTVQFILANLVVIVLWVGVLFVLAREHKRRSFELEPASSAPAPARAAAA